jgi:hypothetical protein
VGEILALGARGGIAEVHVGGNVGARIAAGELRMVKLGPREAPEAPEGPGDWGSGESGSRGTADGD